MKVTREMHAEVVDVQSDAYGNVIFKMQKRICSEDGMEVHFQHPHGGSIPPHLTPDYILRDQKLGIEAMGFAEIKGWEKVVAKCAEVHTTEVVSAAKAKIAEDNLKAEKSRAKEKADADAAQEAVIQEAVRRIKEGG